ncbi:exoglucanase A-like [Watersipora subatra]|uniref:exoglucanase A-like n=1 Tax=Watersipora subatra TaxID=2589382 RepID=UPI00355BF5A3
MAATRVWSALVLLVLVFLGCSCQTTNPSSTSSVTATNTTSTKVLSTTTTVTPTTTPAAPSPPSAPQLLSRTNDSLSVNWTGTASFYMLQHGARGSLNDSLTNRTKVTTAMITGLIAGETYSIKVVAYNDATGGTGVPGPATNITTKPNSVSNIRVSGITGEKVKLEWAAPSGGGKWDIVNISCVNGTSCNAISVSYGVWETDMKSLEPGQT